MKNILMAVLVAMYLPTMAQSKMDSIRIKYPNAYNLIHYFHLLSEHDPIYASHCVAGKALSKYSSALDDSKELTNTNIATLTALLDSNDAARDYYHQELMNIPEFQKFDYDSCLFFPDIEVQTRKYQFNGLYNRAALKFDDGNYIGAKADGEEILKINPSKPVDDPDVWFLLGMCNVYTKNLEEGCVQLNKAADKGDSRAIKAVKDFCSKK